MRKDNATNCKEKIFRRTKGVIIGGPVGVTGVEPRGGIIQSRHLPRPIAHPSIVCKSATETIIYVRIHYKTIKKTGQNVFMKIHSIFLVKY